MPPALVNTVGTLLFLVYFSKKASAAAPTFNDCAARVAAILNGTGDPLQELTRKTLQPYLYHGPVTNLDESFPRDSYTTLTYEGCRKVCRNPIDWYPTTGPQLPLSIAANWIIPILTLIATLPFDSLHATAPQDRWHDGRLLKTSKALSNWLGSPPTAMTATLFNIFQIWKCKQWSYFKAGTNEQATQKSVKKDVYFVLSCLGQFELPKNDVQGFLEVLVYGLFRPLDSDNSRASRLTQELVAQMAFQLRMYRRRGLYPAGINILAFLGAFGISVGLAFADLGEWTTAHSLALGLLFSWLPMLNMFSILDRNPISAVRNRILLQRWLWNVKAIKMWEEHHHQNPEYEIDWWSPAKEHSSEESSQTAPNTTADMERQSLIGRPEPRVPNSFEFGEFIGQGRKIGYNGVTYSILGSVYNGSMRNRRSEIVNSAASKLNHKFQRPLAWWICACISLVLVWLEILMAFIVSYGTPTVGLSCRSGLYLIYGTIASTTWLLSLVVKSPGNFTRAMSYIINTAACLVLSFIVFAQFTGILNNCVCKCGFPGYMSFQAAEFYKQHFDVQKYWALGAIFGGLPVAVCFVASAILLFKLKPLWAASEQLEFNWELDNLDHADTRWVA